MIVLLGCNGYIGSYFSQYLESQDIEWLGWSRKHLDLYDLTALVNALRRVNAKFLINCAGYTGKPNVDACELHKAECLQGNAVLPGIISEACERIDIPWGHLSSGCVYTGISGLSGFTEEDPPNFTFRQNNCSFYSGTKALGEEILRDAKKCYVWRIRIPFNNHPNSRNYLQKLITYDRLLEVENSLSCLNEVVPACVDCYRLGLPFGIYNLTNPGIVKTSDVVRQIHSYGLMSKPAHYFTSEEEFMRTAAKTPRSSCVLNSSKAMSAGLRFSRVEVAIDDCLRRWGH